MGSTNARGDLYRIVGLLHEEETGRPLPNLIVRAFDKDLFFDDKLGFATTDDRGRFEIRFRTADFQDALEAHPDLYLRIYDPAGTRLIHETTDAIRFDASRVEKYHIAISGSALAPGRST